MGTMTTIKSYTDLSQSKVLAKILPHESADMSYIGEDNALTVDYLSAKKEFDATKEVDIFPCWSLTALLNVVRKTIGYTIYGIKNVYISCELGNFKRIETDLYDNEVDACVAMIVKLHEQKLL